MLDHRRNPLAANIAVMEHESEELRSAMCSAEDSLAIQLLIEICAPTKEEVSAESGLTDIGFQEISVLSLVSGWVYSNLVPFRTVCFEQGVHFLCCLCLLLPIVASSMTCCILCELFSC